MRWTSTRYPELQVNVTGGDPVRFTAGTAEVTDPDAIDALHHLPDDYQVQPAADQDDGTEDDPGQDPGDEDPPSRSARVQDWRAYAVRAYGADPDQVAHMSRTDLIAAYGGE